MAKDKTVPVTALKTLGGQAPRFDLTIFLKKLDGTPVELTIKAKAMRKTEWAKLRDERQRAIFEGLHEASTKAQETKEGEASGFLESALANLEKYGVEAGIREGIARDASLVFKFAEGWSLNDEFTKEGLEQLEDDFGGTLAMIVSDYEKAIYQGRLGN